MSLRATAPKLLNVEGTAESPAIAAEVTELRLRLNESEGLRQSREKLVNERLEGIQERLERLEARVEALLESLGGAEPAGPRAIERNALPAVVHDAAPPPRSTELTTSSASDTLEGRLLRMWNDFDWEQGSPSLSQAQQLLRDASYELVEGIVGTYALAVPHRIGGDSRSPVYILALLGKANSLYDGWLFERPQKGDSARLAAAAKVQFIERGGSQAASLERLKAGNEKLSKVFTVVELGRIE